MKTYKQLRYFIHRCQAQIFVKLSRYLEKSSLNMIKSNQEAWRMRVPLPWRFNVEWMLNHIRTSSYGVPYRFVDQRVLRRPLWLSGASVVAEFDLSQAGVMGLRLVSLRGHSARPSKRKGALLDELTAQTLFLWGLNDDAEDVDASMASDRDMAPLLKRFGALRIVRALDLYEALLVAVIGQQVSVQAAQSVRRRLMQNLGTRVTVDNGPVQENHYLYPTPQQVIEAGELALREQGLSRQKSTYLLEIANRAATGELDREAFATLSDENALSRLCEIKGVGRWTAEIALMRGLGRNDVFAAGDLGLQVAVQELLGMPKRPTEKALRKIAERWKGWRSYAAFYLWMTLQSRAL
jgi:3-methyladenine DNA glycosylase/8-oxoguanine DNA glycosylase